MPQLGISFHQCLIAEGFLYLHFGLSRDTYTRLHNKKEMFAQAKWQSHNDGV
jgi:hypothetical protein